MNLGYIMVLGIFFNLMLGGIFPYQLLDDSTINQVIGEQKISDYYKDSSGIFDSKTKEITGEYTSSLTNQDTTSGIISTTNSTFTNILADTPVSYFDAIVDSMKKIKTIISMLIPFASMFFLLPGFIGYIMGSIYTSVLIFATLKFIRGIN